MPPKALNLIAGVGPRWPLGVEFDGMHGRVLGAADITCGDIKANQPLVGGNKGRVLLNDFLKAMLGGNAIL